LIILGLNAYHPDSSAALIRDGRLIAAAEEERFTRIKHWAGFPQNSIAYCLQEAGVQLSDVDHVAINQDSRANFWRKVGYVIAERPRPRVIWNRLKDRRSRSGVLDLLQGAFPTSKLRADLHAVEHHIAHLSSAFHVSPFDEAVIVSVDGFGDFSSAAWGVGAGKQIKIHNRVHFPHSLGIFYQAITQYLGFPQYGDEYKVMGLAPYGQPAFVSQLREMVRMKADGSFELNLAFFQHHRSATAFDWVGGTPVFQDLFSPALEQLLGPRRTVQEPLNDRHRDIARSVQSVYEEAFFNLLARAQSENGFTDLALAGGCAMNSVANGKVRRTTPFRRLYVQSAAGDAGGAIGAAFATWHDRGGDRSFVMDHAYWGPAFSAAEIERVISSNRGAIDDAGCEIEVCAEEDDLCSRTAGAIASGKVVGWFQGRMEWGPRALGNRSILCDPRRADIKEILNAKIKRRESFRPFAPSILQEAVPEWFEEDDCVPFMMQVFQVKPEKRALIPAVTHVDGSGRLQTVSKHTNSRYYNLIRHFSNETGVPMVLNTSFNENEPVVCTPSEALSCFLRTQMDVLVLGDLVLTRSQKSALA
jgi:carbamoyltransferase